MSSEQAKRRIGAWLYFKAIVGFALLIAIGYWVDKRGDLLQRLTPSLVLPPSIAALGSITANALSLRFIVRSHGRDLSLRQALIVSAAGTLGNALGGLPVGTALKYWVVRKTSGLGLKDLTMGLILVTVAISGFLLLITAASIWGVALPVLFKAIPAFVLVLGVAVAVLLYARERHRSYWSRYLAPFLVGRRLGWLTVLGLLTAVSLVVNYLAASATLSPEIPWNTVVFVASLGMLAGQGTLLQSVGGVQEFMLGLSAHIVGMDIVTGVQLALLMRIAAVIAAGASAFVLSVFPAAASRFQQRRRESRGDGSS